MEKEITIKYKLIENIILGKDEKGKDKIIYLNEKIPDSIDNNPIKINISDGNYKVLLNMNEVISNINKKFKNRKGNI